MVKGMSVVVNVMLSLMSVMMDHIQMCQPSAHRAYLQQSTKEKVEVLHRRHHMFLWKRSSDVRVGSTVTCVSQFLLLFHNNM